MPNTPLRYLIACLILLSACSQPPATPVSLVSPTGAATPAPVQPTTGAAPAATPTPDGASVPDARMIAYYQFVAPGTAAPQGSVVVLQDAYILAPARANAAQSADPASDLRSALEAALSDPGNLWVADKLEIASITVDAGHVDVLLQGERYGVGDVTLIAARMQILMTIFADAAVQSARVTFNGDTIGNWGVSNSMNARPADYVFTRAEIESFMMQNAYKAP